MSLEVMSQIADVVETVPASAERAARRIVFQGQLGAYSHLACRQVCPRYEALPADSFGGAFAAVRDGGAERAMIPIENSIAGRVADIHHLMPHCGLHIIGEHFLRVNRPLVAVPGARLEGIKAIHSHVHALNQCRRLLRELAIIPKVHADTAGAAAEVAEAGRPDQAAIASRLAAEIYGLEILRADIEDAEHNTTRFIILAREPREPPPYEGPVITSFLFQVRNVPAALYKALGGFATNGVNMIKLESYVDARFSQAQFYAEVLGHPEQEAVKNAFEELAFFSHEVERLGVYPADPFRFHGA